VLPIEGLKQSAQELSKAFERSAGQRNEYWKKHVQPFWKKVWPKDEKLRTPEIARCLALLIIKAGNEFPAALDAVKDWLQPIENYYRSYVVGELHQSDLCSQYPKDALYLLDAICDDKNGKTSGLKECLDQIGEKEPKLKKDAKYKKLN